MTESAIDFFLVRPPAEPEPEPKGKPRKIEIQTIKWDRKREKEHDRAMKLAAKALKGDFRLPRDKPLTLAESKELRAERQRQRRASKALSEAIL
jgi:hypothetical protein